MATIVIYPLLFIAYKENLEQQENGNSWASYSLAQIDAYVNKGSKKYEWRNDV